MTKYILAGGNDRTVDNYPAILKRELPKTLSEVRLLSCFFSVSKEEWQEKSQSWQKWFADKLGIEHYDWANYDNFTDKLGQTDIVYFHGGNTKLLLKQIVNYPQLQKLFDGKIVIGSSAGANMLSKNYWSSTLAEPGKGLGVLDINIMVHYGANELGGSNIRRDANDWEQEKKAFQDFIGTKQPVTPIPEGNIKVFESA